MDKTVILIIYSMVEDRITSGKTWDENVEELISTPSREKKCDIFENYE